MDIRAQLQMGTTPPSHLTVESQTQEIYDAMMGLGTEIDMLESVLSTVLHASHPEEGTAVMTAVPSAMPEAVRKLNGLLAGACEQRKRLESIRLRLALQ